MTITMDSAGRLVIPKDIRREAGIEPGMPLEIRCHEGSIVIEPQAIKIRLEKRDGWVVAVPVEPVPPMDHEIVERTINKTRNGRGK